MLLRASFINFEGDSNTLPRDVPANSSEWISMYLVIQPGTTSDELITMVKANLHCDIISTLTLSRGSAATNNHLHNQLICQKTFSELFDLQSDRKEWKARYIDRKIKITSTDYIIDVNLIHLIHAMVARHHSFAIFLYNIRRTAGLCGGVDRLGLS